MEHTTSKFLNRAYGGSTIYSRVRVLPVCSGHCPVETPAPVCLDPSLRAVPGGWDGSEKTYSLGIDTFLHLIIVNNIILKRDEMLEGGMDVKGSG